MADNVGSSLENILPVPSMDTVKCLQQQLLLPIENRRTVTNKNQFLITSVPPPTSPGCEFCDGCMKGKGNRHVFAHDACTSPKQYGSPTNKEDGCLRSSARIGLRFGTFTDASILGTITHDDESAADVSTSINSKRTGRKKTATKKINSSSISTDFPSVNNSSSRKGLEEDEEPEVLEISAITLLSKSHSRSRVSTKQPSEARSLEKKSSTDSKKSISPCSMIESTSRELSCLFCESSLSKMVVEVDDDSCDENDDVVVPIFDNEDHVDENNSEGSCGATSKASSHPTSKMNSKAPSKVNTKENLELLEEKLSSEHATPLIAKRRNAVTNSRTCGNNLRQILSKKAQLMKQSELRSMKISGSKRKRHAVQVPGGYACIHCYALLRKQKRCGGGEEDTCGSPRNYGSPVNGDEESMKRTRYSARLGNRFGSLNDSSLVGSIKREESSHSAISTGKRPKKDPRGRKKATETPKLETSKISTTFIDIEPLFIRVTSPKEKREDAKAEDITSERKKAISKEPSREVHEAKSGVLSQSCSQSQSKIVSDSRILPASGSKGMKKKLSQGISEEATPINSCEVSIQLSQMNSSRANLSKTAQAKYDNQSELSSRNTSRKPTSDNLEQSDSSSKNSRHSSKDDEPTRKKRPVSQHSQVVEKTMGEKRVNESTEKSCSSEKCGLIPLEDQESHPQAEVEQHHNIKTSKGRKRRFTEMTKSSSTAASLIYTQPRDGVVLPDGGYACFHCVDFLHQRKQAGGHGEDICGSPKHYGSPPKTDFFVDTRHSARLSTRFEKDAAECQLSGYGENCCSKFQWSNKKCKREAH